MSSPAPQEARGTAWPFGLGMLDDVPKRFPPAQMDPTAIQLVAIAQKLDTRIQIAHGPRRAPPPTLEALQPYVKEMIGRPDDVIVAPPAEIRRFLDEHVVALDDLRTTLTTDGAVPHWYVDINTRFRLWFPDYGGYMQLFRILAADALDHCRRGDSVTAWLDLQAGWLIAQSLFSNPDFGSPILALNGMRIIIGVAAKLPAPAPNWYRQLLAFDTDRALASGMQFEAWRTITFASQTVTEQPGREAPSPPLIAQVAGVLLRPARQRMAYRDAAALHEVANELARLQPCRGGLAHHTDIDNLESVWQRRQRFRVEREAASKLLSLKELRRASGAWPDSAPGIERSSCSDGAWNYSHEGDGSMSLSFRGAIAEEQNGRNTLPLSFHFPK